MNRNLILSIIACATSLAFCPAVQAQDASAAAAAGGLALEKLTTDLTLTADQQAQVKPILETASAQILSARQEKSLPLPERLLRAKQILEDASNQIDGLLTPDQQAKFAALKEQIRERPLGAEDSQPSPSPSATQ
jgi:Spy/CpxP family protein refolding chaperone